MIFFLLGLLFWIIIVYSARCRSLLEIDRKSAMYRMLIFMCGLVAGLNLAYMLPNPNYDVGWHKVVGAVVVAVILSLPDKK